MTDKHFTIGEAAARSGMSTRTLRFYSDTGLLPPRARTQAGYRMYTDEDVSRLELIATLRKTGAPLKAIKAVLHQRQSLKQVLEMRLAVLEQDLRTQARLAAVLRLAVKNDNPSADDLSRLEKMTELSRNDRMATVTAFMDDVTDSIERNEAWTGRMVEVMAPDLPENPSRDQVDAWLDICRLFEDRSFKRAMRAQAADTSRTGPNLRVYDSLNAWRTRQNALLAAAAEALNGGALATTPVAERLADQYIAFMA